MQAPDNDVGAVGGDHQWAEVISEMGTQGIPLEDQNDDQSLFERAQSGCRESLGELLELYRPWLTRLATGNVDPTLRAKLSSSDLVQGALVKATDGFEQFEGSTLQELKAWVKRIYENYSTDRHREVHAQKRDAGKEDSFREDKLLDQETPGGIAVRNEDIGRLLEAIAKLNEDSREIVKLKYLKGISFEEIGEELGLSRHIVSRRWYKAIEALSKTLGDKPSQ